MKIDPEFKALIPPLAADEYVQLEANIIAHGCRDPLVTWRSTLLDGHNRLEICTNNGLPYATLDIDLPDKAHALLWIEENQMGRRNLSDDQRATVGHSIQKRRSKLAREERGKKGGKIGGLIGGRGRKKIDLSVNVSDKSIEKPKKDTRAATAKELKIPERKLRDVAAIEKADKSLIPKIRDGEMSIPEAKRIIRRAEVVSKLEDVATREQKALEGKYDVIVIDPPWPMEKIQRDVAPNQVAFEYPTMSEDEIGELNMPAADDCHIWLWTTHRFLPMALRLLDKWQFKYVCTFVWHKPGGFQPFGLPQYNCEFALYGRRGSPKFIDTKAFPVCFNAARGAHSEKPEEFYDVVRRVTGGRRIDIFNRRSIEGFDTWGKEAQ